MPGVLGQTWLAHALGPQGKRSGRSPNRQPLTSMSRNSSGDLWGFLGNARRVTAYTALTVLMAVVAVGLVLGVRLVWPVVHKGGKNAFRAITYSSNPLYYGR